MLRIAAFSTLTGRKAVHQAAGVPPRTFPPDSALEFKREWLEGFDLLYFHLHGIPDQPYWYGDGWVTAIGDRQILECRLAGCTAFVANCYGGGSRMVEALLQAGAQAVVAGPGPNFTARNRVRGADRLGMHFVQALRSGANAHLALAYAKNKIRIWALLSRLERDAMQFQIQEAGI